MDQVIEGNSVTINFQKGDLGELKSANFANVVEYTVIIKEKNWNTIEEYYNGIVYQR